jgi:hypothetical protein
MVGYLIWLGAICLMPNVAAEWSVLPVASNATLAINKK